MKASLLALGAVATVTLALPLTSALHDVRSVVRSDTYFNWNHPGTFMSREQINKLKFYQPTSNITQYALQQLMDFVNADLDMPVQAVPEVRVIFNPGPAELEKMTPERRQFWEERLANQARLMAQGVIGGNANFTGDAARSYQHTIAYLITQEEKYARKAIDILTQWSKRCQKWGLIDENGPLEAGWGLATMAMTAELLKYTYYDGWAASGVEAKFRTFVETILMPQFEYRDGPDGLLTGFVAEGNWGTTITQARLQYAIFTQNNTLFDLSIRNAMQLFPRIIIKENGLGAETVKRDVIHGQFGIAGLAGICEILWHQGIDLFSTNNNILRTSYEYHASILLGEIPEDIKNEKLRWVRWLPGNWWIAYNHYVYRQEDQQLARKLSSAEEQPFTSEEKLLESNYEGDDALRREWATLNSQESASSSLDSSGTSMPQARRLLISRGGYESFSFHWGLGTLTHFATTGRTSI